MKGKILCNAFLIGICAVLLCGILFFAVLFGYSEERIFKELAEEASYAAHGEEMCGKDFFTSLFGTNRITWIDSDGTVLFDSLADISAMPNHLDRSEISDALKTGVGKSTHFSQTQLDRTLNYAVRVKDGTVIRISCTQRAVTDLILVMLEPFLFIILLVSALCAFLSFRLSKQITKPINAIDPNSPSTPPGYKELEPLVKSLEEQKKTIQAQLAKLEDKQREFSAITDNMNEGFLLVDSDGNILSCNKSALNLISDGDDLITDINDAHVKKSVRNAVEEALAGRKNEFTENDDTVFVRAITSPVVTDGQVYGAVMLLIDVTESERREALRREFSANVSHELKTPLTSISGFAELMANGLVPYEKTSEFASDIYSESRRLIALIDDIINLSRLDEGALGEKKTDIDLYDIAKEVCDSLQVAADKHGIHITLNGDHTHINGVSRIITEMIYNLCDNAIKYNKEGGSVTVSVSNKNGIPSVTLKDTGIGIPYSEQNRVFERFYRVDKSHSKEIGGTGLGLSIVKHGALYHKARIELHSEPGKGTEISVFFNGGKQL